MILYGIQVITFQLLFLLVYDLFLKKETFFNWNRIYLIGTSLLAFVLPFIKVQSFQNTVPQEYVILLPEIVLTPEKTVAPIEPTWNWFLIIGIAISTILFSYKIIELLRLRFKGRIVKCDNYTIISIPKSTLAFSIFRYVFIGENIDEAKLEDVLSHELVHVREKHSLDLLYFEVLRILCWFNPMVYIYQKRISELHEYIADAEIVKGKNKSDYYEKLLTEVFQTHQFSFTNQFFKHSLIKKRIIMLTKQKSREILKLKYLVLVPVLILSLVYTSCKTTAVVDNTKDEIITQTETLIEETATEEEIMPVSEKVNELSSNLQNDVVATKKESKKQVDLVTETAELVEEDATVENYETQPYEEQVETVEEQMDEVQNVSESYDEKVVKNDKKIYSIEEVDKLPVYPGCETLNSQEKVKKCLQENVQKHVLRNFNMSLAGKSGLKGKQKISAKFVIEKNGKVRVAKTIAPNETLSKEIRRVLNALPKFIPAEKGGKPVSVQYLLPIAFKIQ